MSKLNTSGYEVYSDNILVEIDLKAIKTLANIKMDKNRIPLINDRGDYMTTFGLVLARETIETETNCATEGFLVDMGEDAFKDYKKKPKLGQLLTFTRYAGRPIFGNDGKIYRRLGHKEINGGSTSKFIK